MCDECTQFAISQDRRTSKCIECGTLWEACDPDDPDAVVVENDADGANTCERVLPGTA